jgi:hypothetical protein
MSPINFPDSPTPGDVFRDFDTGYKYEYDGVVWKSYVDGSSSSIKVIDDVSSLFDSFQRTFELRVGGTLFYPISAQHIRVALNGELQTPYTDYTVSGAQITFDVPPTPGTEFSVVNLLVTAESPYTESYLTNLDVENKVTALSGVVTTILGTNIEYVGVGSFGTVAIGETVVINSDQGLENILSIDPTTSQTIYDSLLVSPTENFPNINVAGVSTLGFITSTDGLFVSSNSTTPTVEITQNGLGDAAIIYGRVGINTSEPNRNATIYGTANVINKNAFDSETIIGSYYVEVGAFLSGIGTPSTSIDLHGGSPDYVDYSTRLLRNAGPDGSFMIMQRGLGNIEINGVDGAGFYITSGESITFSIDGNSGNVGINTTDASEKLVVVGNAIVSDRVSIGSTLKVLEDAWVRNTLSVGSSEVWGSVPTDEGVISAVGNGKNVIIIQADENTDDRGLAFRNEFDRYAAYINLAPNNIPYQGDLVFGHAVINVANVDDVPEILRLSNGGVGIGTTIARESLHVFGGTRLEGDVYLRGGMLVEKSITSNGSVGNQTLTPIGLSTGTSFFYDAVELGEMIPHFRYNASTTLYDSLDIGESVTVSISANTNNIGFCTTIYIDGALQYLYWPNGVVPTTTAAQSRDKYVFNIMKTGVPPNEWTVMATVSNNILVS